MWLVVEDAHRCHRVCLRCTWDHLVLEALAYDGDMVIHIKGRQVDDDGEGFGWCSLRHVINGANGVSQIQASVLAKRRLYAAAGVR